MSASRAPKLSSTDRRRRLAARVESLGSFAMAACPQCESSHSICVVHKSSSSCAACLRKNIKCGGRFSDAEFDALEARKAELRQKKMAARARLRSLAWEMVAAQKVEEQLDAQLSRIHDRQERMMDEESRALDELDCFVEDAGAQVALMTELDFSLGDPSWEALLAVPEHPAGGDTQPSVLVADSR